MGSRCAGAAAAPGGAAGPEPVERAVAVDGEDAPVGRDDHLDAFVRGEIDGIAGVEGDLLAADGIDLGAADVDHAAIGERGAEGAGPDTTGGHPLPGVVGEGEASLCPMDACLVRDRGHATAP